MIASYDLHLHSFWSYDATMPIENYFLLAKKNQSRAIAITDHNNADGFDEISYWAKKYSEVPYILGTELTINCSVGEVDILCFDLPKYFSEEFKSLFAEYNKWQRDFGKAISSGMSLLNFDYNEELRLKNLEKYRPQKAVDKQGITHVNNSIQRQDFIDRNFIAKKEEYWVLIKKIQDLVEFPKYPNTEKIISTIKSCGGKIFIAHPSEYFQQKNLKIMNTLVEELSLDGIECAHPSVTKELTEFYRNFCLENKLLSSGGSDNHFSDNSIFANHIGQDLWLDEIFEQINIRHGEL